MALSLFSNGRESFSRQFTLSVEDRPIPLGEDVWNGSFRWFKSPNVIDLWRYRSRTEQLRMIDLAWDRRRNQGDGGPMWPPATIRLEGRRGGMNR
jgi:hypothetical protein